MNKLLFFLIIFHIIFIFSVNELNSQTFTDTRDGMEYKTITIGSQVWMAENLAFHTGMGCWAYNNKSDYYKKYGYLYNWTTAKKACPDGWHLPTDREWVELELFLGMEETEKFLIGQRAEGIDSLLKSTEGWDLGGNGLNQSGFNAQPGGYRDYYDWNYSDAGKVGYWWTSSRYGYEDAWFRSLSYNSDKIFRGKTYKEYGHSVRCVKD